MKTYKESITETYSMSHEYVLNSLADKDINAHVKDGKIVVAKEDAHKARAHLKKIGHDHIKVTHVGAGQVAEDFNIFRTQLPSLNTEAVEVIDELSKGTLKSYVKKADDDRSNTGIKFGEVVPYDDSDFSKKFEKGIKRTAKRTEGIRKAINKLNKEELDLEEGASNALKTKHLMRNVLPRVTGDAVEAEHKGDKKAQDIADRKLAFLKRLRDKADLAGVRKTRPFNESEAEPIHELSDKLLARYKIKAKEDSKKAWKEGDHERSDKRYNGHIKASMHQLAHGLYKGTPADLKKESLITAIDNFLAEARAKKEPMTVYHPSYSSAVQHAREQLGKQGYEVSDDHWWEHVNNGPKKPSEGKTVQLHLPLHKDGVLTKKRAHIQVYNRGNDIKNNNELNMYVG